LGLLRIAARSFSRLVIGGVYYIWYQTRRRVVRTNIVLDERLVREAMKLAGAKTMREAVDIALLRFVQSGRQKKLLDLYGTGGVRKDYNYRRARSGA
jgi:Arc/MetJ family transcription regulator